ncbi:MAG: 23S rRNA (uracil(1939)-C(5))-methyltransferase RlmD [Bacteroidales bacterium]|nr:23S rRNA (uracil(1939)-C(5))-methyltransferase RlmD [Bacteroidales bacterium]
MSRKNKEQPVVEDLLIEDIAAEGKALAHLDGKVVFVPFVVPGDVADVKLLKRKKSYCEGKAVAIKQYSSKRVPVQCPHFGVCGGCKWQMLDYACQLEAKQRQVRDMLQRLGSVNCDGMRPICGSERIFRYRNKLEYTFSTRAWLENPQADADTPAAGALGFHIPGLFDKVLNIESCVLQDELSNRIRLFVRDYAYSHNLPFYDIRNHTGFLRNLVLRNNSDGQWMVILIVADHRPDDLMPLLSALRDTFPQINSLHYIINTKMNDSYADLPTHLFHGEPCLEERMKAFRGDTYLRFRINPKSFYQTNSAQAQRLYSFVAEFADLQPSDTVYDLYTGTGTIAQFVASMCRRVVGIEYVKEAIDDAKVNAALNNLDNTEFFAGDMADILTDEFISLHGTPDVVITDPPRAGMHEKVVRQLLAVAPRKIIYVSCNPATQARDLQLMAGQYDVARIQPVDMFPHTQHVENIAELIRK